MISIGAMLNENDTLSFLIPAARRREHTALVIDPTTNEILLFSEEFYNMFPVSLAHCLRGSQSPELHELQEPAEQLLAVSAVAAPVLSVINHDADPIPPLPPSSS